MPVLQYSNQKTTFEGYLSIPPGEEKPRPCVLVAHAWDGPNSHFNRIADELALAGYAGFAIDVYGKGLRGQIDGDNSHLMNPLLENRLLLRERLITALEFAKSISTVDSQQIAILGYCFGGLCALDLARANPEGLKGAISVHGSLSSPAFESLRKIDASVLVLHGWEDPVATPENFIQFTKEMTDRQAGWQVHCYGHAKHAFTFEGADIPSLGIKYDKKAHFRSQKSIRSFLEEIFKEKKEQLKK